MPRKLTEEEILQKEARAKERLTKKELRLAKKSTRRYCSCGTALLPAEVSKDYSKCSMCRKWERSKENFAPLENWLRALK